ncbi:filamentous hemagglutinin N-terminal domain-containing protein [Geobacter sp. FeAm09]|uniref:two-partner secretion domain-containing protein n=1 Tax=Geobacter sp. FeAm09 TaxID=2597769 RepID=UPI0011EDAB45|nr:filamentous hemagglutinin N-terminal domain-containing protein [Geobacter sp. FeAm09]QEM68596.1 filamentous hemagglutinin N-terminal domain-containing protein [Geobacter sp. FeAm09]
MHVKSWHGRGWGTKVTARLVLALWGCQLLATGTVYGAPTGGVVTSGSAAISQSGSVTNVNQSTNTATINWTSFSTAPTETVNFNQPSTSSITLNRVIGNEASVLQGALNATGKVFLINSNGILMTKGSTVNTAGFVASTLNITDADFNAGNYVFKANGSTGSVVNMGTITASDGGYVAMLGNSVSNQGVITATKGTVALASGDKITLNFNGDSLASVTVDEGTLDALVENKEAIYADGGTVILTAKAADELLSAQVNNSGLIQARTVDDLKGSINLHAYGGTTTVAGTLDASAPTAGDGGLIETSGDSVKIADSATITTKSAMGKNGTWLIDPDGFTVGTTSADGDMTATALTNALANGNVTISSTSGTGTDGDIDINAAVSWSANTLTLNATNNIYVNAAMTATGSASLAANYGHVLDSSGNPTTTTSGTGNSDGTPYGLYTIQSATNGAYTGKINFSGTGTVTMNGANYIVINALTTTYNTDGSVATYGLDYIQAHPDGNYVLGSNIAYTEVAGYASWTSIDTFTGNLNGFGHYVSRLQTTDGGLIHKISGGSIVSNLGIVTDSILSSGTKMDSVGLLADYNYGSIVNSFAAGTIGTTSKSEFSTAGGLVGSNYGLIAQSYFTGIVYASYIAGGLVGINETSGKIIDSSARGVANSYYVLNTTGATGITYVGGFVGENEGDIERSYSTLRVNLTDSYSTSGGFAGLNTGTIDQSYSAMVTGDSSSKGPKLAGFVYRNDGTITNAYTTLLSGTAVTWLAGFAYINNGAISNSYAATYSPNTTNATRCGFVCTNTGTLTDDYWYGLTKTSGATTITQTAMSGLTQLTTYVAATSIASYAGFDPDIWGASTAGNPILKNMLVYVTTTSAATYGSATAAIATLGLAASGLQGGGLRYYSGTTLTLSGIDNIAATATNPFAVVTDAGYVDAGARDASEVLTSASYSNIAGIVTVTPKTLTATATVADKTYDGTTTATLTSLVLSGLVGDQTLTTSSTATFSDKNAGDGKTVTVAYTAGDGTGKASNYVYGTTTTTTASIEKKTITVSVTGNDKTYDGTTTATVSSILSGVLSGDTVTLGYSASFADKNAGTDKAVTVSGFSLGGTDGGNYTLGTTSTLSTTATINPLVLALAGIKGDDGVTTISAGNLTASNIVAGDTVTLGGTATVSTTPTSGSTYALTDTSGLTVSNPNYTVAGSAAVSYVIVGGASLILNSVASGTATITTAANANGGTDTTVTTSTDKTVIDWTRFNIASGETVTFAQPSTTAIVLNRVVGYEASVINGTLASNGRVFLINSNGILFAAGSTVNTAGLVASALQLTDADFLNSNYVFTVAGSTSGSVVAKGDIIIADGGFLALISNNGVTASGSVTATDGTVLLASADQMTLTLNTADTGLAGYAFSGLDGTATVGGTLTATGGLIETAGATVAAASGLAVAADTWLWTQDGSITIGGGGTLTGTLVNAELALCNLILTSTKGDITVNDALAWTADTKLALNAANAITVNKAIAATGTAAGLALTAAGGDITVAAPLTATGDGSALILTAADAVTVNGAITANGGLTLTATGGDLAVNGTIGSSGANAALALAAGGDIVIGKAITASGANATLALTAGNDIAIDADVTLTGANAALAMNYGGDYSILTPASYSGAVLDADGIPVANAAPSGTTYAGITLSGANAKLAMNGTSYTLIHSMADLAALDDATGTATGSFALAQNLDASGTTYSSSPIAAFSGTLAGLGHTISNLKISTSSTDYASLIGQATASTIRDIGVVNADASGAGGILAGTVTDSTVSHAYTTGKVNGGTGGLLGNVTGSTISYSYSDADGSTGGGLIGWTSASTVTSCHATGDVTNGTGGLIGTVYGTNIESCYATGTVGNGTGYNVGGLVGSFFGNDDSTGSYIVNSFAKGSVSGKSNVGGLVGYLAIDPDGTTIANCHATGNVEATATGTDLDKQHGVDNGAGGLIGTAETSGTGSLTVTDSYATGNVVASDFVDYVGGVIGLLRSNGSNSIFNSYATGNVTGYSKTGFVGGLVGYMTNTALNYVHTTGTITGAHWVGGLAGFATGATIDNSYSAGFVIGSDGATKVGGLIGGGNATGDNNYWNGDSNNSAAGSGGQVTGDKNEGLTSTQMSDADHYVDGTINQVLQDRADAAAAAIEAAREALPGEAAAQGSQTSGQTVQSVKRTASLATQADAPLTAASVEDQIEYADSASYSADIDSINVDGVQYDLRDKAKDKKK